MAREWIEFIQSQCLPWHTATLRAGVEAKTLSHDAGTGAASLLIRYPAGWRNDGVHHLTVDEEFLVLEGELEINGRLYSPLAYAHLPGGFTRRSSASASGAVVLTFFSAAPSPVAGERPGGDEKENDRLVIRLDALSVPYTGNFHPEFPPGAGRKSLFEDPITGDQTWILGTMALRWAERQEVHPIVEEMYLLSGEVHGNCGVMRPGAYFWRPPGKPHGPYGTLTGNLYLFRTKGGKLQTEYIDSDIEFAWRRPYRPVLPDRLKDIAYESPPGQGYF